MNDNAYSLSDLRDLVIPEPPPAWPPAPGFWLMLGIVAALLGLVVWYLRSTQRRNAYRRAGLALLESARTAHDVDVILKRVALAAFPRERVASLYGDAWRAFLGETCPWLDAASMVSAGDDRTTEPQHIRLAARWIRHHRVGELDEAGG